MFYVNMHWWKDTDEDEPTGGAFWGMQEVPAVGDKVVIKNERYRVVTRTWISPNRLELEIV